jgi:hypothetical protein
MSDIKQVRWMSSKSRAVSALKQNLKAVAGHQQLQLNLIFQLTTDLQAESIWRPRSKWGGSPVGSTSVLRI